ncbi:hypothetical protein PM082_004759 [Marasmius tenuissimus]|nr:hypothetical protein PM082_004759 [Marasmius tenuissimus]
MLKTARYFLRSVRVSRLVYAMGDFNCLKMAKNPANRPEAAPPLLPMVSHSDLKLTNDPPHDSAYEPRGAVDVFQLPASFDYDALVASADREQNESDLTVAEDLSTSTHTVFAHPAPHPQPPLPLSSNLHLAQPAEPTPVPSISYNHWKRKLKRKAKREADAEARDSDQPPSQRTIEEAIRPAKTIRLDLDAAHFDAAKGAHTAKPGGKKVFGSKEEKEREHTLQDLVDLGYIHIPWDRIRPLLIVDCKGRIVAILAGRPNRSGFVDDMMVLFEAMVSVSERMGWDEDLEDNHKRGKFHAYNRGVTMGMGSQTPVVLSNGKEIDAVLNELVSHPSLSRLSGYHNHVVKLWEPQLHKTYKKTVEAMHEKLTNLTRNFRDNIFTAAAFNFGGRVRTIQHRDHLNWPFGLCVITALGRFNAKRSAHLVLKEFNLVVDFPHASTAAIPSACITHFNTAIAPGDTRTSFTQYTAGAIFRWVENGFRTNKAVNLSSVAEKECLAERKRTAVAERLKLYSLASQILVEEEVTIR